MSYKWRNSTWSLSPLAFPECHMNVVKAYQSLEPGDFTGFLKILRSPPSQHLQSRCTAFLNTMEAYHVSTVTPRAPPPECLCSRCDPPRLFQALPVQKQADLVQDFYQSFANYFSSE